MGGHWGPEEKQGEGAWDILQGQPRPSSSWGPAGSGSRGSQSRGGIREGTREPGEAICRWALRSDCAGRRSPSGGRRLQSHSTPHPHPALPLVPEELPDTLERPLRARFLPRSAEIRGAQFRKRTRTHYGPRVSYKAGQSRRATGGGAREPHGRRVPAAQPAGAPRSGAPAASRDLGTRAPAPRRPPAWSPDWPQTAGPGPGAGFGAGAEPGPRPVSGCSGNGDVPRRGRGKHAGCIF